MNKIIEYQKGHFYLKLQIENGIIKGLCKNNNAFIYMKKLFVHWHGAYIKHFDKNGESKGLQFINRNALCFDLDGNLLWQIQPSLNVQNNVHQPDEKYSIWPYHSLYVENNKLYAACGDLWTYEVNPYDGTVKRAFNSK